MLVVTQQLTCDNMSQNIDPVEAIDLENGLIFARHDAAAESIEKWEEENFCPLTKARSTKASMTKANVKICARRDFKCSHGIKCSARGGSQETMAEIEVNGMRGEIKLLVDSDLKKVLKIMQMDILG